MVYDWKNKPIEMALRHLKSVRHLKDGGFNTIGELVDASPEEIAARVDYMGVKRAVKVRDLALKAALNDALYHAEKGDDKVVMIERSSGSDFPMSAQVALFIAFVLSIISFVGLIFEVGK